MNGGWIGFDLDGTLAEYGEWVGPEHIGAPIQPMVSRLLKYLAAEVEVRIFTARIGTHDQVERDVVRTAIEEWCLRHIGRVLAITNVKDYACLAIYDDRAVAVEKNTGRILGGEVRL